jgi:hypothetical protein
LISQGDLVTAPWYNWDKDWDQPNLPRFSLRSGIVIERGAVGYLTVMWSGGKVESLWSEDDLRLLTGPEAIEPTAIKTVKRRRKSK